MFSHGTYRFPWTQQLPMWLSLLRWHRRPSHNHVEIDLLERSGRIPLFQSEFHAISRSAVKARNVSSDRGTRIDRIEIALPPIVSGKWSMWICCSYWGALQFCPLWQNLHWCSSSSSQRFMTTTTTLYCAKSCFFYHIAIYLFSNCKCVRDELWNAV